MNTLYQNTYRRSYLRHGDSVLASKVALAVVKKNYSEGMELIKCAMEEPEMVLISNAQGDMIQVDILLANKNPRHSDGKRFTDEALTQIADQINSEGSSLPDVEHAVFNRAKEKYGRDFEAVANAINQEKGRFKSIKAMVKDGQLWVQALFEKKYADLARSFKKVSIEFLGAVDKTTGVISRAKYLGFTFTRNPELAGAGVAI